MRRLWLTAVDFVPDVPGDPRDSSKQPTYVGSQISISLAIGIVSFLVFCILRMSWTELYEARGRKYANRLPRIPATLFGWIKTVYSITDEQVLESTGLDAYVFLSFFKMSIKFFTTSSIFGLIVVAPVKYHFTGDLLDHNDTSNDPSMWYFRRENVHIFTNDTTSPVDIIPDKSWLWSYVVFVYFFTILLAYFLISQTRHIVYIKQSYLGSQNTITDRTILLSGIPSALRDEDILKNAINNLNIGEVDQVVICRRWNELDKLLEQRMRLIRKLEECYSIYSERSKAAPDRPLTPNNGQLWETRLENGIRYYNSASESRFRPKIRIGFMGLQGKQVDAIDFYLAKIGNIEVLIDEYKRKISLVERVPLAFVTFRSVQSAQLAAQAVIDPTPLQLVSEPAPSPYSVIWENTYISDKVRLTKAWIVTGIIAALTVLWVFPISFFAAFLNLKSIKKVFPWLAKALTSSPELAALVQGFLPTLAFTIFNACVPFIFAWLSMNQGYVSSGSAELSVVSKNYFYLFFNFFLVFTIAGTVSNVYAIFNDTTKIAYLLAESLPGVAKFYVNLIILQGVGMVPFRLLEFGYLFTYPILRIGCKTERDFEELKEPPLFHYGFYLPFPIFVFNICLIYSVIYPFILIAGLVYFVLGHLVFKYQLLYAMEHRQHSTGLAWPMIFHRVIIAAVFYQITMVGILALKKAYTLAGLLAPLVIATVLFGYGLDTSFHPPQRYIALRSITQQTPQIPTLDEEGERESSYIYPGLIQLERPIGLDDMLNSSDVIR